MTGASPLTLRPVERADAAYIMGLMNHEQVADRSMLTQHVTLPRAMQSVKDAQDPDNVLDMWLIVDGSKRFGKVNSIRLDDGDMLLGFSISPEHKNKGVATEGLKQLIALLVSSSRHSREGGSPPSGLPEYGEIDSRLRGNDEDTHIKRLQALVEPDNIASIRVLEKNDFERVGLIERSANLGSGANRDLLLYEIIL